MIMTLLYNDYNATHQEVTSFYALPSSGSGSSGDNPTVTPPTITPTITPVTDINYRLSDELWFMICCAFMTPILEVIMFFVVHHFWTQKFLIEIVLDLLIILVELYIILMKSNFTKTLREFLVVGLVINLLITLRVLSISFLVFFMQLCYSLFSSAAL